MTEAAGPISVPPPAPVVAAGVLGCLQAAGVVILAVVIVVSGFAHSAGVGQLLSQGAFYVVLAAAMAGCGLALLKGRRWGRTPTIVVQVVLVAVGYQLAVPSGRVAWGVTLMALAVVTGGLLLTKAANDWISRFPPLFGPEPGR